MGMTFWKDKWFFRRIDRRYDSLETMSVWVCCPLLKSKKIKVVLEEGFYDS